MPFLNLRKRSSLICTGGLSSSVSGVDRASCSPVPSLASSEWGFCWSFANAIERFSLFTIKAHLCAPCDKATLHTFKKQILAEGVGLSARGRISPTAENPQGLLAR